MGQLLSLVLVASILSGCAHPNVDKPKLKSVQMFKSNSGANYIFVSKNKNGW